MLSLYVPGDSIVHRLPGSPPSPTELGKAVAVSTVFIPGDLAKAVVASFAALIVKRSYPLIRA